MMTDRSQTTRLLRTEVIWKVAEDIEDDPNERCPVNLNALSYCSSYCCRKRKTLLSAVLAIVIVAAQRAMSTKVWRDSDFSEANDGTMGTTTSSSLLLGSSFHDKNNAMDYNNDATMRHTNRIIALPQTLDRNLADANESLREGDVPYFFHTPRAMGQTTKDIVGNCVGLNLTTALNLTNTMEGIAAAKKMDVFKIGGADMIVTQYLHAGATLFDGKNHRGRMFTFVRNPIERAVSMFHYLGTATHEPTYDPDLAFVSLEMWSRSMRVEHNWMTRFLSNELEGDLTMEHLDTAKEVLRKKCLVGLFDDKAESWLRIERFFGWKLPTQKHRECFDRLLNWGWSNKHLHPLIEEGSVAWDLLYKHNELDMMLYRYAQFLFEEQRDMF